MTDQRVKQHLLHDDVSVCVGMKSVVGKAFPHSSLAVFKLRVVVDPEDVVGLGVLFQQNVQIPDAFGGVGDRLAPREGGCGRHRAEDKPDAVRAGEFMH